MSQILAINSTNSAVFGEKRRGIKTKLLPLSGTGKITWSFLLVSLICVAGVLYIFEVNNAATQGYNIQSLEKQVQELKNNNENLKIKEAELRSMYNIEEKTKDLNMTAPKDVSYLTLPGNVAMK
jgi:cell division protein FtsL